MYNWKHAHHIHGGDCIVLRPSFIKGSLNKGKSINAYSLTTFAIFIKPHLFVLQFVWAFTGDRKGLPKTAISFDPCGLLSDVSDSWDVNGYRGACRLVLLTLFIRFVSLSRCICQKNLHTSHFSTLLVFLTNCIVSFKNHKQTWGI